MQVSRMALSLLLIINGSIMLTSCSSSEKNEEDAQSEDATNQNLERIEVELEDITLDSLTSDSLTLEEKAAKRYLTTPEAYILTDLTLTNLIVSIHTNIKVNYTLNEQQQQCVDSLDKTFANQPLQKFFEKQFTVPELQQLNEFYKSRAAITYTKYGRDQLLIASGHVLKKPARRPRSKYLKQVKEFSESPLGIKYKQVTSVKGEESLSTVVLPLLTSQIDKCAIDS